MNSESGFIELIKTTTDLPLEQENIFKALLSVKYVKQGEHFVRAGRVSRTIAFVKKGLFSYFYTSEEEREWE